MRIIRQSSFTAVPWKNGGGVTHEALRMPPAGDAFLWRVSVAQIDASGPFSDFAAYRRVMVLLKGAGVLLRFAGGPEPAAASGRAAPRMRELRSAGDLAQFDGGLATHCELLDGPCVDLNLMVSKTLPPVPARVETVRKMRSANLGSGESMLVFPLDAAVELGCGDRTGVLEPWDLALLSAPGPMTLWLAPDRGGAADGGAAKVFLADLPAG